jgi:hypothetical protein
MINMVERWIYVGCLGREHLVVIIVEKKKFKKHGLARKGVRPSQDEK